MTTSKYISILDACNALGKAKYPDSWAGYFDPPASALLDQADLVPAEELARIRTSLHKRFGRSDEQFIEHIHDQLEHTGERDCFQNERNSHLQTMMAIESELQGLLGANPELNDPAEFAGWLEARKQSVAVREIVISSLRDGQLVALYSAPDRLRMIDPQVWGALHVLISMTKGELCTSAETFKGVVLERVGLDRTVETLQSFQSRHDDLTRDIAMMMRDAAADERQLTKNVAKKQIRAANRTFTERGFDRAWQEADKRTGLRLTAPGRRKGLGTKTPQETPRNNQW